MKEESRISAPVRDKSPCCGCTEKFTACHDRCPKDLRGEYGYKAFREQIAKVKGERRKYDMKYSLYFHDYKEETKDG